MSYIVKRKIVTDDIADGAITQSKLDPNISLGVGPVPIMVAIPVPTTAFAADSTGVKWTSDYKIKWYKSRLSKVRIRATWISSARDCVEKICIKDTSTGADIVCVSGYIGTDVEAETTDLTNVTDGGLAEIYAEVTTASSTYGATFTLKSIVIELIYGS